LKISIFLYLLVFTPMLFFESVVSSAWLVLRKGIRSVPPLITAVVVVFVTSDAWRILGAGFTPRFFVLVTLFLLASMLFLTRRFKHYWEQDIDVKEFKGKVDVDASEDEVAVLLRGIRTSMKGAKKADGRDRGGTEHAPGGERDGVDSSQWRRFNELLKWGAKPTPLVKPTGRLCQAYVYAGYITFSAFFLIFVALFVSGTLILVGLILINAKETGILAQSADIYWTLWGNVVISRQLLSLSLSLGAFAAFFLVAAQRTEDRKEFTDNMLARLRQILLVYSVYCRARDHAAEWTGVSVKSDPRDEGPQGRNDQEEPTAAPGPRSRP
jgi:hypothetical protein